MKTVTVKKSRVEGTGVFAARDFRKGEIVVKWHPEKVVSKEQMKKLSKDEQNHVTPTENGRYLVMGIPERYVNHSCSANTLAINCSDVAIRNIKKSEEITSDYSFNSNEDWEMNCNCKSKNCRGIVYGSFFKLPVKLQKKYLPYLDNWFKEKYKDKLKELK